MVRRQHRQEPEQRLKRHRRARQKLGRLYRRFGQAARARDFGSERFPLQRRVIRHRLYGGATAVGDQRSRGGEGSRRRGRSQGFAQQLHHQRKKQKRKNHIQPLQMPTEGAQPLTDFVKKALTRRITDKTALKENAEAQEVLPDERLVLGTKFAIAFTFCLSAIEIANLALLGTWNSEVFAAITGLAGTITGILISQKSS